jgi:pimeloyl-ACP methyl ester carboxylesterase
MARESIYEGVGHLPFIEERERYNDELAQFAREVSAASDREGG